MTAAHEPFAELAAGYALGALDADDRARFAAHLATGCAECRAVVAAYDQTLAGVAAESAARPPADIRGALLGRIAPPRPAPARWRAVATHGAGMALAASLAVWLTGVVLRGRYEPRIASMAREASDLRAELEAQGRTLVSIREQLAAQERTLALLQAPDTRVVSLAGLAPSPAARARLVWNAREGGVLVTADLPPAPEGKVYELWAIAAGTPRPAGVFAVDAAGRATLHVAALAGVETVDVFAVTLEPAGGVPAPTGAMYLASKTA